MKDWNIQLGDKVTDRLSKFAGIVTGRAEYLFGCRQVLVAPDNVKDAAPTPGTWLDEDRVEVVKARAVKAPASAAARAGGPLPDTAPPKTL